MDVVIDIRGKFFYTRTVPCQLWFFDRAKERDIERADRILMLDVRNLYRKVSRAIYDFSPEQQKNTAAIVWLYRGQSDRFLKLVESYLAQAITEGPPTNEVLAKLEDSLGNLIGLAEPFATEIRDPNPLGETWKDLTSAQAKLSSDMSTFGTEVTAQAANWNNVGNHGSRDNAVLNAARYGMREMVDRCRDMTKQINLVAKLARSAVEIALKELKARRSDLWSNAKITRARRALEDERRSSIESLRRVQYFVRQADWLQERFPGAKLRDVQGLVKLVDGREIKEHDWSLTPGRYVGVAPEEEDEEFDFEKALRSIHIELRELNEEAVALAARIARNFEELGA